MHHGARADGLRPFAALRADSGTVGGGSDGDDALNLAVRALVGRRYPYGIQTCLGVGPAAAALAGGGA
jgi:hypothetical protein